MKKNLVPLLGIAFVAAILSTGIFYGLFVGRLNSASQPVSAGSVVLATRNLDPGAVISESDVVVESWSGPTLPEGARTQIGQVKGATVLQPVLKGEPVVEARLVSKDGKGGPGSVPSGMRAVSTHVSDSSGILAVLRPGLRVDVQVANLAGGNAELRTILQDIEVLSVHPVQDTREIPVVTLLVTPDEADRLALGDSFGRVRLVLRNPLDRGQTALPLRSLGPLLRESPPLRTPAAAASKP